MSLGGLIDYAGQESTHHLAVHGWEPGRSREQLRGMLIDAVDLYIALRPAMQQTLNRFNKEFAGRHLEMEMLTLKGQKDGPEYRLCQRSLGVHKEMLNEDFDALLKTAAEAGKIASAQEEAEDYSRLWAVEIVRKLLRREAEAPFGVPAVSELALKRERDDVLARLMEA